MSDLVKERFLILVKQKLKAIRFKRCHWICNKILLRSFYGKQCEKAKRKSKVNVTILVDDQSKDIDQTGGD